MKTASGCEVDWITLRRGANLSLFQQLFNALRSAILNGRLKGGTRLPSTRHMASQLHVSRNTVSSVFEQLVAEGYLQSKRGSGTCVVDKLPEQQLQVKSRQTPDPQLKHSPPESRPTLLSPSLPAVEAFPLNTWQRLGNQIYRQCNASTWMDYGDTAGYWPLRELISDYLTSQRGLICNPNRILIVNGAQQALDLISRTLLNEHDSIWVEDPCYKGARNVLQRSGATLHSIPVDSDGLAIDKAINKAVDAKLAFVTPSHQYPLGAVLSLRRRLQLLEWASQNNSWIIEDDYGGEYRYTGKPLMALQGLDNHQRVIYLGSFSKVLFPSLRLAYMVLPTELVDRFTMARELIDTSPPVFTQMQLSEFIRQGYFTAHIRKMRTLYAKRKTLLYDAVHEFIPEMQLLECESGMHVTGVLSDVKSDQKIAHEIAKAGLRTPALSTHYFGDSTAQGLLLGFASTPETKILPAIKILRQQLNTDIEPR